MNSYDKWFYDQEDKEENQNTDLKSNLIPQK